MSAAVVFLLLLGNETANYGILKNDSNLMGKLGHLFSTTSKTVLETDPLSSEEIKKMGHTEKINRSDVFPLDVIYKLNIAKRNYLMIYDNVNLSKNSDCRKKSLNNYTNQTNTLGVKNVKETLRNVIVKSVSNTPSINNNFINRMKNMGNKNTHIVSEHDRHLNYLIKEKISKKVTQKLGSNKSTSQKYFHNGKGNGAVTKKNIKKAGHSYASQILSTINKPTTANGFSRGTNSIETKKNNQELYDNHKPAPKILSLVNRLVTPCNDISSDKLPSLFSSIVYMPFQSYIFSTMTSTHKYSHNEDKQSSTLKNKRQNETATRSTLEAKYDLTAEVIDKISAPIYTSSYDNNRTISASHNNLHIFSGQRKPLSVGYNKNLTKNGRENKSPNETTSIFSTTEVIYLGNDNVTLSISDNSIPIVSDKRNPLSVGYNKNLAKNGRKNNSPNETTSIFSTTEVIYLGNDNVTLSISDNSIPIVSDKRKPLSVGYNKNLTKNGRENKSPNETTSIFSTTEVIYLGNDNVTLSISDNSIPIVSDKRKPLSVGYNKNLAKNGRENKSPNETTSIFSTTEVIYLGNDNVTLSISDNSIPIVSDKRKPLSVVLNKKAVKNLTENKSPKKATPMFSTTEMIRDDGNDGVSEVVPKKIFSKTMYTKALQTVQSALTNFQYRTTNIFNYQRKLPSVTNHNESIINVEIYSQNKTASGLQIEKKYDDVSAQIYNTQRVGPSRKSNKNNVTFSINNISFPIVSDQRNLSPVKVNYYKNTVYFSKFIKDQDVTASWRVKTTEKAYLASDQITDVVSQDSFSKTMYTTQSQPINSTLTNLKYSTFFFIPNTDYRIKTSVVSNAQESKINVESDGQNILTTVSNSPLTNLDKINRQLVNNTLNKDVNNMMHTYSIIAKSPVTEICLEDTDIMEHLFENTTETQIEGNMVNIDENKENINKSSTKSDLNLDDYYVEYETTVIIQSVNEIETIDDDDDDYETSEKNEITKTPVYYNTNSIKIDIGEQRNSLNKDQNNDFVNVNHNMIPKKQMENNRGFASSPTDELSVNKSVSQIKKDVNMPFHAAIYQSILNTITLACDGVIINYQWVLTVAHCVDISATVLGLPKKLYAGKDHSTIGVFKIVMGAINPKRDGITYNASRIIMHPKWNLTRQLNNIALIRTSQKIIFEPGRVGAIAISENELELKEVQSYGWLGLMQKSVEPPLKKTFSAKVLSQTECKKAIELGLEMGSATDLYPCQTSSQICMLPLHGEKCSSNSGGPIVANGQLVGIGEFDECDDEHTLLGIRVSFYAEWIKNTIKIYK